MERAIPTGLTYRGHEVSGYGLVYDPRQNLTWTQLGEFITPAASWGTTQSWVRTVNSNGNTFYGIAGGWRLPLAAELQGLYLQLPSVGPNKTGMQWFGPGPHDFIYVAHPSYWSRYEVGTNLIYVFFFSNGNAVLTMASINTYSWLVRDGDVGSDFAVIGP